MNHDTNRNIIATESTIGANELLTLQHLGSSSEKSQCNASQPIERRESIAVNLKDDEEEEEEDDMFTRDEEAEHVHDLFDAGRVSDA